jgi:DNA-binding NtrC family response regulator
MMSGHATIDTAVEATRIGALNFLEKPIALQKLLKAVQQGLSRAQESVRLPAAAPRPMMAVQAEEHVASAIFAAQAPQAGLAARMGAMPGAGNGAEQGYNLSFDLPLREARDAFERMYFEHHLGREGGSMTRVAEKTGLERTHLYRKLKQLGVEPGKLAKKGQ